MYQTAAHLPARRLQNTRIRTHVPHSAHHFSHELRSAILVAMQNVLILLAMNRNFSTVMQPHTFVVTSTAMTICIPFEVFKAIKIQIVVLWAMTPYGLVSMF